MKFKKVLVGIILASALVSLPFLLAKSMYAEDLAQASDQSSVLSKLDQILNNEKAILDQISSMRQELNVIKIRVTQQV